MFNIILSVFISVFCNPYSGVKGRTEYKTHWKLSFSILKLKKCDTRQYVTALNCKWI